MGCIISFCLNSSEPLDCVRVIHINGYIEDFLCPVTASQITGKPPKHMLCTSAQLLSVGARPLRPEDPLESGRIYFLLPHSVFHSDSSPIDLASMVTRLTAAAKRAGPAEPVQAGMLLDSGEEGKNGPGQGVRLPQGKAARSQTRTWTPVLETIREMSFRMRESAGSFGSKRIGSMREIVE